MLWLSDRILFIQIDLCMSLYDGNRISCNHKDIDSIHLLVEIRVKPGYFFVDIKVGESSFLCFKFWVQQVLVCSVQTYRGLRFAKTINYRENALGGMKRNVTSRWPMQL